MKVAVAVISSILLITCTTCLAAPRSRPFTGRGLLVMVTPFMNSTSGTTIRLFREPGSGWLADFLPKNLPDMQPAVSPPPGGIVVAVHGSSGDWLKVAYDDAGREGWLARERFWRYMPWEDYLVGRSARLLPGLRREFQATRNRPDATADGQEDLSGSRTFAIAGIRGDWALVTAGTSTGWLRWRDDDGRFLIAVGDPIRK